MNSNSILSSVKKLLGIADDYDVFDNDIIMDINTVFMILHQMGVGPDEVFYIESKRDTWDDFLSEDDPNFHAVKTYIELKVKMMFDPPISSTTKDAVEKNINELEWRLHFNSELNTKGE